MDLEHNQRKWGLGRSWPMQLMQPYWENDVATAVDNVMIDSTQALRGMLLHTVFSHLPPLALVAHHTYLYKTPFTSKAPVTVLLLQDLKKPKIFLWFVSTDSEV